MHLKLLVCALVLLLGLRTARILGADSIALVTSRKSMIEKLSPGQIRALYLGETRRLESGTTVELGDRDRSSEIYRDFYQTVTDMTPKDVAVHWAKKVFTGKATPPVRLVGDDEAAKNWVKARPDAMTYISSRSVDSSVKVIGLIGP